MLLKSNQNKIGKVAALNWFTLEWRRYFQYDPDFERKIKIIWEKNVLWERNGNVHWWILWIGCWLISVTFKWDLQMLPILICVLMPVNLKYFHLKTKSQTWESQKWPSSNCRWRISTKLMANEKRLSFKTSFFWSYLLSRQSSQQLFNFI